jgi:hypothetical protein
MPDYTGIRAETKINSLPFHAFRQYFAGKRQRFFAR